MYYGKGCECDRCHRFAKGSGLHKTTCTVTKNRPGFTYVGNYLLCDECSEKLTEFLEEEIDDDIQGENLAVLATITI